MKHKTHLAFNINTAVYHGYKNFVITPRNSNGIIVNEYPYIEFVIDSMDIFDKVTYLKVITEFEFENQSHCTKFVCKFICHIYEKYGITLFFNPDYNTSTYHNGVGYFTLSNLDIKKLKFYGLL